MADVFIYELIDPRNGDTKYIGKTIHLAQRMREHFSCKANPWKYRWMQKLRRLGLTPELNILETTDEENWSFWEQWWISLYKTWNIKLINLSEGGDSPPTASFEQRQVLSAYRKGKTYEEIFGEVEAKRLREHHRQLRLGYKHSTETKKKMSKPSHRKGKKIGPNFGTSTPIYQLNKKGDIVREFYSITEASNELNLSQSTIQDICKGKVKKPRFHNFKYKHNG
jgi:group I intron endonuclease